MSDGDAARGGWPNRVLVTGGAGFIGCNLVRHLTAAGVDVAALDNLSRPSAIRNLASLRHDLGDDVEFIDADVRDAEAMIDATATADAIVHLAGQTAVTRSITDPRRDFLDNALGTFNMLEGARLGGRDPIVLYSSTNKVYGALEDLEIVEERDHYRFADLPNGVDERRPVDFASPYACSKGAGESYVVDYARTLRAAHRHVSPVVHLRGTPDRRRGTGMVGLVSAGASFRTADHDLRRRQAGQRSVARR